MKQKIIPIQGCRTCNEVLIFLDKNEEGEHLVRIIAWHKIEDEWFIQSAEAGVFKSDDDFLMMCRYIADFSEVSANEFACSANL